MGAEGGGLEFVALLIVTLVAANTTITNARILGGVLNFRTLFLVNATVVSVVSGMAYLGADSPRQGYVVVESSESGLVAIGNCLAVLAACLGCRVPSKERALLGAVDPMDIRLQGREKKIAGVAALVSFAAGVPSLLIMRSYAESLDVGRIVGVSDGLARYAFASQWVVWGIVLGALVLIRWDGRAPTRNAFVVGVAGAGIAGALSWSGGRSIILLLALPLLAVVLPHLKGVRAAAVPLAIAVFALYVAFVTQQRLAGTRQAATLESALDWQWGRYSMLAFALRRVDERGLSWGQTLVAGLEVTVNSLLQSVGLLLPQTGWSTASSLAGADLLGDPTMTYVVPGLVSELYLNFGIGGIVVGAFLLGRFAGLVDRRFSMSSSILGRVGWAYIGSLLVLRTFAAESAAFWPFVVFTAAPLWAAIILSRSGSLTSDRAGAVMDAPLADERLVANSPRR